jgi:hypothetical protein
MTIHIHHPWHGFAQLLCQLCRTTSVRTCGSSNTNNKSYMQFMLTPTMTNPTPSVQSKIYAGRAMLAVVMWSWGRATGGANANNGISTAPLRASQTIRCHSTNHAHTSRVDKPGWLSRILLTSNFDSAQKNGVRPPTNNTGSHNVTSTQRNYNDCTSTQGENGQGRLRAVLQAGFVATRQV